jgi:hypothetical protein
MIPTNTTRAELSQFQAAIIRPHATPKAVFISSPRCNTDASPSAGRSRHRRWPAWRAAVPSTNRHVRKVAESTRARTCRLSRPGTTWQRITRYRVARWRCGGLTPWQRHERDAPRRLAAIRTGPLLLSSALRKIRSVPRLRLGTHGLRGSASRAGCEAEPRGQGVPRPSLGTRGSEDVSLEAGLSKLTEPGFPSFPNSVWERTPRKSVSRPCAIRSPQRQAMITSITLGNPA